MMAPGKYDKEAETLLEQLRARGLILLVVEGIRGTGLSMKATAELTGQLPGILRRTADLIESEVR